MYYTMYINKCTAHVSEVYKIQVGLLAAKRHSFPVGLAKPSFAAGCSIRSTHIRLNCNTSSPISAWSDLTGWAKNWACWQEERKKQEVRFISFCACTIYREQSCYGSFILLPSCFIAISFLATERGRKSSHVVVVVCPCLIYLLAQQPNVRVGMNCC